MRLIDGDALIKELNNSHFPGAPYVDAGISIAIGKVCDAPAIEPERKTGTWQRKYSRPGVYADLCWHCSICGGKFSDTYANMWKYCPDCGATMEETE